MQEKLEIGLIGNPCAGSMSPLLHSVLASSCGIELRYHLWEPDEQRLSSLVMSEQVARLTGLNVTAPFKGAVISSLNAVSPLVKTIGAANTLIRTQNGFYGANTDVYGFSEFLKSRGIETRDRKCLLFGAGGAAKAAAYALASEGAQIFVWSRNEEKGKEFVRFMNGLFPGAFTFCEDDDLYCRFFSLIVNTIPLRSESENVLLFDHINASLWVDINYSVSGTPLCNLAEERGIAFADGKEMLFYQGLRSFELWNDYSFSAQQKKDLLKTFLKRTERKIVLIGFMGTGKSTVARFLEQMAGFKHQSTDLIIKTRSGKSVSRIFSEEGEKWFRAAETKVLAELLQSEKPCVIDTGGGIVESEENRRMIKDSGALVIWLDCTPRTVLSRIGEDSTRPLAAGKSEADLTKLMEARRPLYREIAHIRIDSAWDPALTAKEIYKRWSMF